jgi:UDP-glucose 4-epimerase
VNVVGTVQVLLAAQEAGARVVFTSTGGAIYGECATPANEDTRREPGSPYGIAKLCGEEYLYGWNRIHDTSHVVTRLGNVFGPRQSPSLEGGVVSIFLDRMARGGETIIFGDGRQERDFVYVGDVVAALLAAAGHDGGVFNVGTGLETSVLELYGAIQRAAGVKRDATHTGARLGELQRSVLDASLAAHVLGWNPARSLDEGLAETWRWMEER